MKFIALVCSFLLISILSISQYSMLDASFGNSGRVTTTLNGSSVAQDVALQSDGKIVVITRRTIGGANYMSLLRYNTNGSIDNTFDTTTKIRNYTNGLSLAIQPDDKIVVGLTFSANTTGFRYDSLGFTVGRFHSNGIIDSSFGNNGFNTVPFAYGAGDIKKVVVKPDGKIIAAGFVHFITFHEEPMLAQFTANGKVDSTFRFAGVPAHPFGLEGFNDITLTKDGKLLVAAQTNNWGFAGDFNLVRYLGDGTIDSTFGTNGLVRTDFQTTPGYYTENAESIVVLPDNSIVVTGTNFAPPGKLTLAKYTPNGLLDITFGDSGKVVTPVQNLSVYANNIVADPVGNLYVSGYTFNAQPGDFVLAKYYSNGRPDSSFGRNGVDTTDFFGASDISYNAVMQPDGKIVLAGYATTGTTTNIALARYTISVLPLKLVSFTATNHSANNLLAWSTANEFNVARFEIERSNDGKDYLRIGSVKAGSDHYIFKDEKPLRGANYYRLKMIDKDGQFEYSATKLIQGDGTNMIVKVFPLPAKGNINLQIRTDKKEEATIYITELSGKVVVAKTVALLSGVTSPTVDLPSLRSGVYMLKLVTSADSETMKILVQQ